MVRIPDLDHQKLELGAVGIAKPRRSFAPRYAPGKFATVVGILRLILPRKGCLPKVLLFSVSSSANSRLLWSCYVVISICCCRQLVAKDSEWSANQTMRRGL